MTPALAVAPALRLLAQVQLTQLVYRGDLLGDETVNLAKVLDNLSNKSLNIIVVGSVELVGLGLDAVLLGELLDVLVGTLLAGSVGDGDVGAHLSCTAGSLDTHAAGSGSAGDDDDLALEAEEVEDVVGLGDLLNHCEVVLGY
jgi:hypothetical protein